MPHKGLSRFTLRGKNKVNIQWKLFAIVHNIGKINNYGLANAKDNRESYHLIVLRDGNTDYRLLYEDAKAGEGDDVIT